MTFSPASPASLAVGQLRQQIRGRIIAPDDPEYDAARATFYGGFDRRPAVIVRVADDADVAHVVSVARDAGVELAVRSGGHSLAGYGVSDGGIVLDLSDRRALEIDPSGRTAWAEAGVTAVQYSLAADEHGLGTGFGDTGSVGLGGLVTGGGVGYLVRKHGLTIDDLLAADVVTADGQLRRADPSSESDLFWAIRGGGGNFGVVTRFQLRLHDVSQSYGGMLILPATPDTVAGFVAAAGAAPEELSAIANVMPAPPMPFLPEEHHGRLVIFAMLLHVGSLEAAEQAVAPFRALAEPLVDMVKAMRYPEIYPPDEPGYQPTAVARTMFVERVDRAVAETILERLGSGPGTIGVAQLRVLGGAMARVAANATAFAHRDSRIMVNVAALFEDPADASACRTWVDDFARALQQGDAGAYVNFLADEGPDRVRAAYPGATWHRLRELKRRYDPTNLFRLNHNIPPATD